MDNLTFGMTLIIVGMGGTVTALGMFALMMGLLKKMFPAETAPQPAPGQAAPVGTPPAEDTCTPKRRSDENDDEAVPC